MVALKSANVVKGISNGGATLSLGTTLATDPLVIASQSTRKSGRVDDGGWARVRAVTREAVDVAIDEDTTCNKERKHGPEQVSVVVFDRAGTF